MTSTPELIVEIYRQKTVVKRTARRRLVVYAGHEQFYELRNLGPPWYSPPNLIIGMQLYERVTEGLHVCEERP